MRKRRSFTRRFSMLVLAMAAPGLSGEAQAATPSVRVDAVAMNHSTGGADADGWNLWSNGTISQQISLQTDTTYQVTVLAKATLAQGQGANMVVKYGNQTIGSTTVSSSALTAQFFQGFRPSQAQGNLVVQFTNDLNPDGPEDRNLIVNSVVLTPMTQAPAPAPSPIGAQPPMVVEAETMTASTGGAVNRGWNLWSNGTLTKAISGISAGTPYVVTVLAQATLAQGQGAIMVVKYGNQTVGTLTVSSGTFVPHNFFFTPNQAQGNLVVQFTNDLNPDGPEDRNLIVDRIELIRR